MEGGVDRRVVEDLDKDFESEESVFARARWFLEGRLDAKGEALEGVYSRALAQKLRAMESFEGETEDERPSSPAGGPGTHNWTPVGPSVIGSFGFSNPAGISGRVNSISPGPGSNRVYIGAADGGVWRSENGGASWDPLDDYATSSPTSGFNANVLATGAIAVRFGANVAQDEVFVGTGEPFLYNLDSYFGVGIRHLAAGTWTVEGTNIGGSSVYEIAIDPEDPSIVLAATTKGLFRRPAAAPFTNWLLISGAGVAFANPNGRASSIVIAGTGAAKRYYVAFHNDKVYSSPDAVTWSAVTGLTGGSRIALAASESDSSVIYAWREDSALFRLTAGAFQPVGGVPAGTAGAGSYTLAVAVHPTDPNTVILGGTYIWIGTIGGGPGAWAFPAGSPSQISGVYVDCHAIVYGQNALGTTHDPNVLWLGVDGGVYRSDGGTSGPFQRRNTGLAIITGNYLASHPDTPSVLFMGNQDTGTPWFLGEQAWRKSGGGDGGGVVIDPNNPYRIMRQDKQAYLQTNANGGLGGSSGWSDVVFPPTGTAEGLWSGTPASKCAWYSPLATTPRGPTPTLVFFGTHRLWMSPDWGTSWITLPTGTNPLAAMPADGGQDAIDGTYIAAIAVGDADHAWAATRQTVWAYTRTGGVWSHTPLPSAGLPAARFIMDLAVEDPAAGTIYAALGGAGSPHVFYFNGSNWTAALPQAQLDAPAAAVVVDADNPNDVYVGTDVGVWKLTKTSPTTWTVSPFSLGLPETVIADLNLHRPSRLLRAATHGRGVWEVSLADPEGGLGTPDVYLRVNYADDGRLSMGARFPYVEGTSDPTFQGFALYHWMSCDIKVRRSSLVGLPALTSPIDYLDYATHIGDYVETTSDIETADVSGNDRLFVEVHNRSMTRVPAAQVHVLVLVTTVSGALPALPADYATHINALDTSTAWLMGSQWHFADPANPFKSPTQDLDVRTPAVVEYNIDFSAVGLPAGIEHVCAAAFVTAGSDLISSTDSSLDYVTMHDKHVAHRNLHLVSLGAMPSPGLEAGDEHEEFEQEPTVVPIVFNNPSNDEQTVDIVFERASFPGELAVLLPDFEHVVKQRKAVQGIRVVEADKLEGRLSVAHKRWFERLDTINAHHQRRLERRSPFTDLALIHRNELLAGRLSSLMRLDSRRLGIIESREISELQNISMAANSHLPAALLIQAPKDARPGDRFAFHAIQRNGDAITGGSTFILQVTEI